MNPLEHRPVGDGRPPRARVLRLARDGRFAVADDAPADGSYTDEVHPDDWDTLLALLEMGVDAPDRVAIVRVRDEVGKWQLVEHRVTAVESDGVVAVAASDVTAREHQLARMARTDRYWRRILRRSREALVTVEAGSLVVRDANDRLATMVGRPLRGVLGANVLDVIVDEDREILGRVLDHERTAAPGPVEVRVQTDAAGELWVEAEVSDATGDEEVGAFIVNLRDISDRKEAEARLQASERLFRTLVENLADGAVVLDDAGTIVLATDRASTIIAPGEIVVGKRLTVGRHDGEPAVTVDNGGDLLLEHLPFEFAGAESRWYEVVGHDLTPDPVVGGHLVIFRDVTERRDHVAQLREEASVDPLTGLVNRRGFEDRVRELVAVNRSVGLGYLDIDGFKGVNDIHGHDAGDALLVDIATRLRQAVRPGDLIARFGGDEFVIVISDLPAERRLVEITERIVDSIRGSYRVGTTDVAIGVSAGWSAVSGPDDVAAALRRADERMYAVKGRPLPDGDSSD